MDPPRAYAPMAGAGFASFRRKTRVHGAAAHGNCQRQPSKKNSRAHGSASSAHLAPDNTKPLAKRSNGRRGSRLLSQENSHAWNRRTWELSETAIEEKIRMCVGMPLQHISRRITQNRSLMPRWPARTELPGSLLPGRTSPARGMRKRRRAASPRSAAPSSSARKRRLAVPKAFALHDAPSSGARKRRLPTALCRAALPRSSCRARRFFPNSGLGAAVPAPAAIRA